MEDGDERIIMVHVPVLFDDEKDDWDDIMLPALEVEKSDFLGSLWQMELPPSGGRLYLPVLSTALKEEVMAEDRETEKPTCDTKQLLQVVVGVIQERRLFIGKTRELLDALGEGDWSKHPNQLRKYLDSIRDGLLKHRIRLDLSNPKLIVMEVGDWTE